MTVMTLPTASALAEESDSDGHYRKTKRRLERRGSE